MHTEEPSPTVALAPHDSNRILTITLTQPSGDFKCLYLPIPTLNLSAVFSLTHLIFHSLHCIVTSEEGVKCSYPIPTLNTYSVSHLVIHNLAAGTATGLPHPP